MNDVEMLQLHVHTCDELQYVGCWSNNLQLQLSVELKVLALLLDTFHSGPIETTLTTLKS